MTTKIDYRKNGTQIVDLPFEGKVKIKYVGKCPVSGIRLYVSSGGNDPRGPLGIHAVTDFVASEYDMAGKTISASWIVCNNDRAKYEQALAIAKKQWHA